MWGNNTEDLDIQYKEAVETGKRNLSATKLLNNWCLHAEIDRSPGRGLIEEQTGLPIGHMGVKCKFSKKNMIQCWLFEDAIYDFYLKNCKDCQQRASVGFPNIMSFIIPREKAAEQREKLHYECQRIEMQKRVERREKRDKLRQELTLTESHVFDLLDELDQLTLNENDVRLEQLANLAPEVFTRKIVGNLLPLLALKERLPYSVPVAKALIKASLEPDEKLSVAVWLLKEHIESEEANNTVISMAERLDEKDLEKVLFRFVFMALGPAPTMYLGMRNHQQNSAPIHSLYQKIQTEVDLKVKEFICKTDLQKVRFAVEIILATESDALLINNISNILTKLMYRNVLLPDEGEGSSLLYYLRQAASNCFKYHPEDTDSHIQQLIGSNKNIASEEASRIYNSVFMHGFQERLKIGVPQKIAFQRLLWTAMENPENYSNEARNVFGYDPSAFAELGVEYFDDLIGAAAILSDKYNQVDFANSLEIVPNAVVQLELTNKHTAINSLQSSLLDWIAIGAKCRGRKGIEDFLGIYRKLPEDEILMRGNMVMHLSKLLGGVESIKLVLPEWYSALMDKEIYVRANAVRALETVPYNLVQNFPDLFFEAISILLADPYKLVHQSAVRALLRMHLPKDKCNLFSKSILNLTFYYAKEYKEDSFVVECIELLSDFCLTQEQLKGNIGRYLFTTMSEFCGNTLYEAIKNLKFRFINIPGFLRVVLKAIQDDYVRSISLQDCELVIMGTSQEELRKYKDEIKNTLEGLLPIRPENFNEALLYVSALAKAGEYSLVSTSFKKLLSSIPSEIRYDELQIEANLVVLASEIEQAIEKGDDLTRPYEEWTKLTLRLEKEYEERAKFQDFLPSFLGEA